MKIQVNSDNTISVDARLTSFVESEVRRVLGRFAAKITRVEIHLSDIDNKKGGQADKHCMVEVRPAGARPRTAQARADQMASALGQALSKMQRSLTTFFGRTGRTVGAASAATSRKKAAPKAAATKKKAPAKKAAAKASKKLSPRGPKKKRIYQARRKAWPNR